MSWYDPTSWGGTGKNILNAVSPVTALIPSMQGSFAQGTIGNDPGAEQERMRRALLQAQGASAGQFADQAQGGYAQLGAQGQQNIAGLQRLASGQDSVSAEQLRQGLQQNVAAQQSMAAGAPVRDQAVAARMAMINASRLGSQSAGQQALAGLQERNQAQLGLTGAIQGLRGQDLNAALGGRSTAVTAYGAGNAGTPEKSWLEKYGPAIRDTASLAASDRRLKTDVKDGDAGANKMLEGLKAFTYRYKNEDRHGVGERTGVMAQDLERAVIKHAVIDTPAGKMIHGGHLATANTAMLAGLHKRLAKLEGAKA